MEAARCEASSLTFCGSASGQVKDCLIVGPTFLERFNMFDITSTKVSETALLQLTDAEEAPLIGDGDKQCAIVLYGPGSKAYAAAEAKKNNKVMDRLKRKGKADMSPEEQRAQQADFLAAITVEFQNFTYPVGDGIAPDPRALYMDRSLGFITDQVQAFVGDWGNFSGKSATS
jgi:hypothetical protein